MKHRNVFAVYLFDEIVPLIPLGRIKKSIRLDTPNYGTIKVKIGGLRMNILAASPKCVKCDRVGIIWVLESTRKNERPHLNLYAEFGDKEPNKWHKSNREGLCLMTIDHVVPLSKHGRDAPDNVVPMCDVCNNSKGNQIDPTIVVPQNERLARFDRLEILAARKIVEGPGRKRASTQLVRAGAAVIVRGSTLSHEHVVLFVWLEELMTIASKLSGNESDLTEFCAQLKLLRAEA